jgi:hypothetical protein
MSERAEMKTNLTTVALAAALFAPASAWATNDDYRLELLPAACKAATARIVEATGGSSPREMQPGNTIFKIPGDDPHLDFVIDCGSSPETISAKVFFGLYENTDVRILLAARIAHGLTGEHLSAASDAISECLRIAETTQEDERAPPHVDLQKTHFECWSTHVERGTIESVIVTSRGVLK